MAATEQSLMAAPGQILAAADRCPSSRLAHKAAIGARSIPASWASEGQ